VAEGKKALESNELEQLKNAITAITTASHKIAEVMYKGAGQAEPSGGPSEERKKEDVVEAEVVDDQNK